MGEGEVCVAVVSNVGEIENEKNQQKRDHQWLTGGSDMEPLAKKQAKEGSVDVELDPCARNQSEVALVTIEKEPCSKRLPTEDLNGVKLEHCVDQNMKESSDELVLESCGKRQSTEAPNDNIPDISGDEPIQQCLKEIKQQTCESNQATDSVNCIGVNPSVEQPVKDCSYEMELDPSKHSSEVSNDMEIELIVEQPVKECLNEMELEPHSRVQGMGGESEINLDSCCRMQTTGARSDIELEPSIEQTVEDFPSEMESEACDKMQQTEALNESVTEPSVQKTVKECTSEMESEACEKMQQTEALNESVTEPSVQQPVKECTGEMESEACDKMQQTEALNESVTDSTFQQPVKECTTETEMRAFDKMQPTEDVNGSVTESSAQQFVKECLSEMETEVCGPGALNESELEPSVQKSIKECTSEMEIEACGKMQLAEALNESDPERSAQQPVKECPSEMETEACGKMQPVKECPSEMETEACGKMQPAEVLIESESEPFVKQHVKEYPTQMETEACGKMQPIEALNESEPEPSVQKSVKECLHDTRIELSVMKQTTQALNDTERELSADQSVKECENEIVTEACTKKEASNDDICSEVSNPNVSPRDNSSSFQTVNSQPDGKLVMKDQVVCGEITSTCSGNSSSEGSSSREDHGTNDTSGQVSTSHVILEAPRNVKTLTGVRKITFKFSKPKEDYDDQLSASAVKSMGNAFNNGTRKVPRLTHVSEQGLHEPGDSLLYPTSTEVMPGKVVPESYPTTVKRLLSTRILEGAKVKYISAMGQLIGIIKDCGYLCGCETCNFSNVLRAHEFEEHAGGKTRHPNNHIYLENGKPIYSIIQAMKTAPLSTVDEAIINVAGSSVNEELLQVWKGSLQRNMDRAKTDNNNHLKLMNLYHSTTSCTSDTREDGSSPYYCYRKSFALEPQTFVNETMKERKCLFKKPRSYTSSSAVETKRSAEGGHKKRDNDLHRLLFMPNGLPDGTELAYYARGKKILDGYKQGNGIVCSHCDTEISPSQFEAHAGWAAKRQPYRHIYIPNGLTLHDIALLLANGQSIATSNSDDMCAVCGDRGELVICDGCPRAFHAVCLGVEGVPSDDWHCPYCRDSIGSGRKAATESRPIVIRLTRVVKAREYETGGCVICRAHDFSVAEFDDRTIMLCDQCEKEYHVGCLRENGICDLKALPSDKWFCCDHCDMIHGAIQDVVVNGAAIISGSILSTINRKHIEKGIIGGAPNEIRWRMLSGKSRYPEHLPLLSRAAAIFRECFDPIVARSGRDLIPVMVYGRNISGQEFGGIYCVVLMSGSVVVSAGLLRIFGREVAELPLVATSRQHQGKGYFQALFFCIEELLLSLGVELLVLPAAEEAESIWLKKLGFRKMSDERYTQYSRDIQLTIFKGTSMLEKELCRRTL